MMNNICDLVGHGKNQTSWQVDSFPDEERRASVNLSQKFLVPFPTTLASTAVCLTTLVVKWSLLGDLCKASHLVIPLLPKGWSNLVSRAVSLSVILCSSLELSQESFPDEISQLPQTRQRLHLLLPVYMTGNCSGELQAFLWVSYLNACVPLRTHFLEEPNTLSNVSLIHYVKEPLRKFRKNAKRNFW